jgi:hypothetical protein
MCFGSLVIAVTPTFASIGLAAPIVLAVTRILQGLSLGGEYGTSATYLTEMADQRLARVPVVLCGRAAPRGYSACQCVPTMLARAEHDAAVDVSVAMVACRCSMSEANGTGAIAHAEDQRAKRKKGDRVPTRSPGPQCTSNARGRPTSAPERRSNGSIQNQRQVGAKR